MKNFSTTKILAALCAAACCSYPEARAQFVYETDQELITTGDFNGDGQIDIAIVDRAKGRVRIGYRLSAEFFNWANWKAGGMLGVSGISPARILDDKHDSLALTSADGQRITIVNAPNPNVESDPISVPLTMLGPSTIVAIDVGGAGNTPLPDLYVGSEYNADPTPYRLTLYRNTGGKFTPLPEINLTGRESRGNRLPLKTGGPEFVTVLSKGDEGYSLLAKKLDSGKPETVLTIPNLPSGVDYLAGHFAGTPAQDFIFYTSGETELKYCTVQEAGGAYKPTELKSFNLPRAARQLFTIPGEKKSRLLAIFGEQEPAEVMDFDGTKPPVTVQKLGGATNRLLNTAITLPDAVVLFSVITNDRPHSVEFYQIHLLKDGSYVPAAFGSLASLADRDDSTVPEIYKYITATSSEKSEADMKGYTNTIPGTSVLYRMVPIHGGEFTMGSPESEKGHQPDESPQHKVKVSPFWMGQFEVTWDEYLLFMYADDEKNLRSTYKSDPKVDAVSDLVTRPSKPYVDMSFGMGKSPKKGGIGFPAIAMTQHAASKFCHWLSAKTGHFYRLPTEAEWEYACRAGTTTAYYYGDDPEKLKDYAWYFDNSNSKYQEVGKKLPNPWGLYDMYGNVTEWVLDQYDPEYYKSFASQPLAVDPWNRATKPYPHSVRGGSWDDDPPQCRSAARRGSDRSWKVTDPQLPKSIWYLSDATFVGFRIVRPLTIPPADQLAKYWISGVEKD